MSTMNPNLSELADGSGYYGNVDIGVRRLAVEDMAQNARLDALEAMARGYQEDGALALERVQRDAGTGDLAIGDMPVITVARHNEIMRQYVERERAECQRAETAERERDEAKADADRWHAHWVTSQQELGQWARRIDPWLKHGMWCHWNGRDQPCTCGLAAALASATPAEGGEG